MGSEMCIRDRLSIGSKIILLEYDLKMVLLTVGEPTPPMRLAPFSVTLGRSLK